MKYYAVLGVVALASVFGLTSHAQERAAGSALETQMNWSALYSKIAGLEAQLTGLNGQIEQAKLCGAAEKLYAPGASGADSKGCKPVPKTDITALTNIVNTTNQYNSSEQKCTGQGYVYAPGQTGADKNGCLKPVTGKGCKMDAAAACGKVGYCVVRARYPFGVKETNTEVPTTWKDGETYIWKYASTQNDYGGAHCKDGVLTYFATGN